MTDNYTTLSDVYSKGKIKSKLQGVMVGSFDTMPNASSLYQGQTVIFTGTTQGSFVNKHTYQCQETSTDVYEWVDMTAGTEIEVTANRALASDQNGNVVASSVTDTELGYLDGVTSSIQSQLNSKTDIQQSKGSSVRGIYTDSSGQIQEMTFTLNKSVPQDAVFTDTTYTQGTGIDITNEAVSLDQVDGLSAGSEGSQTSIPSITVDVYGRVTAHSGNTVYPPTTQGNNGQVWTSKGTGAGNWVNQSTLSVGHATSADTATTANSATTADSATTATSADSATLATKASALDVSQAVGSATKGVYIDQNGVPQQMTNSVQQDVPSDAVFTDTTYSQGTGLNLSGTTINHSNSVTQETTGVGSATAVPIIKYDAQGHITETTTATIYPPTTQGTSGQVWQSDGSGVGTWVNQSSLSVGSATTADSATSATTAGSATNDSDGNAINTTYFKIQNMHTTTGSGSSAGITTDDPVAMKSWVNSSIQTNTATFQGTYDVAGDGTGNTLGLTTSASQSEVATQLGTKITDATNNDYAFVFYDYSADPGNVDKYERYKASVSGTTVTWAYEYTLNNSSFTSTQWQAINSGITASDVTAFNNKLDSNNITAGTSYSLVKYDSDGLVTQGTTQIPASGLSGQVSVQHGGTGTNTLTAHNVIVGNGTSQVGLVQPQQGAMYATGTQVDPQFGTLPQNCGGTGQTDLDNVTVGKAKALNNTTAIGGTTTPVYINQSGVPVALGYTIAKSVPSDAVFTDTTYESMSAQSGGTDVSLVTTGEKYTWNNKQATLVSGTNIKTIEGQTILGSGNIDLSASDVGAIASTALVTSVSSSSTDAQVPSAKAVYSAIDSTLTTIFGGSY